MEKLQDRIKQFALVALAIIVSCALWFALTSLRGRQQDHCQRTDCRTGIGYIAHDPYCLVDPVCAAPYYDARHAKPAHWQGMAWLHGDSLDGWGLRVLSPFNYALFVLSVSAIASVAVQKIPSRSVRKLMISGLATLLLLEILRWYLIILSYDALLYWLSPPFLGQMGLVSLVPTLLLWRSCAKASESR